MPKMVIFETSLNLNATGTSVNRRLLITVDAKDLRHITHRK